MKLSGHFSDVIVAMAALGCEGCHHDHPFHVDDFRGAPCALTALVAAERDVPEHTYLDGKASCSKFTPCPCSPDFDPERVPLASVEPIPGQVDIFGGEVPPPIAAA